MAPSCHSSSKHASSTPSHQVSSTRIGTMRKQLPYDLSPTVVAGLHQHRIKQTASSHSQCAPHEGPSLHHSRGHQQKHQRTAARRQQHALRPIETADATLSHPPAAPVIRVNGDAREYLIGTVEVCPCLYRVVHFKPAGGSVPADSITAAYRAHCWAASSSCWFWRSVPPTAVLWELM